MRETLYQTSYEQERSKKMNELELLKNKILAIVFIFLGFLSIFIEHDATFFVFSLFLGIPIFFSKENCILKEDEEDNE